MKAIVQTKYGGSNDLELQDVSMPEPGKGQVRLKVLACSVNLSDWEGLAGSPAYARISRGLFRPKRVPLGSDIVGIVDKMADGITEFSVGDRVMGDFVMSQGGFAEFACVVAKDLVKVPDTLSDIIAACLPQAGGIAVSGTKGLKSGEKLLINGAGGGSGTLALQLAKSAGVHVTAVDNSQKLDFLSTLGADEVIDYTSQDFATLGQKWNHILDMVATRNPRHIARCLTAGGTYRAVGGTVPTMLAILLGGLPYKLAGKSIGVLAVPAGRDLTAQVADFAAKGKLDPIIETCLPLSDVPEALERTGQGAVLGKLVIVP